MRSLFSNIRFYIVFFSICLSVFIYFSASIDGSLQVTKLDQLYGLTAITFLYVALLATPICRVIQIIPYQLRGQYIKARRALGISACYFAILHGSFAFFGELGGFNGLGFLSNKYLLAISLSFTALIILSLMAATSFDKMMRRLSYPKWKLLHRFVYLASIFIIIHVLLLGSHFTDLSDVIPQIFFAALAILLLLEGFRIDAYILRKFPTVPRFGIVSFLISAGVASLLIASFFPSSPLPISFGIHAAHIQLAKEAQQNQFSTSNIPGLQGDKTKRYTVSFDTSPNPQANQDISLQFRVYDASNGSPVGLFRTVYEKPMHLIIVNNDLTYFNHIHPTQQDYGFQITTQFPKNDLYHLYIDYQPFGAIEQQDGFPLQVGDAENNTQFSKIPVDKNMTKIFGDYEVTLNTNGILKASEMSIGNDKLTFTIKDAKTKKPITTLKPYLASFGHLVMINEETYDYLHVHPSSLTVPALNSNGGPTVEFLPLGLYGPIKPGVYRVFAQFNPDNHLFTSDFTIKVE